MSWLIPENDLDPQQDGFTKKLKTGQNPFLIEGFPGSGKSVLLTYAALKLKELHPQARLLFVEFTQSLVNMIKSIPEIKSKGIGVVTYYRFCRDNEHAESKQYDYILCDEVQDLPRIVLEEIHRCSHNVILAGDANQSIYTEDPKWRRPVCTRNDIGQIYCPAGSSLDAEDNSIKLNIIHRLGKEIIKAINSFLPEMNIMAGKYPMTKKNVQVRLWKFANPADEVKRIVDTAIDTIRESHPAGILLRHREQIVDFVNLLLAHEGHAEWKKKIDGHGQIDFGDLNDYLKACDIPLQCVGNGYGNLNDYNRKVTIMTYHSSKGLDFNSVFLPFCNEPSDSQIEWDLKERSLLMVAMSRSWENLFISYTGNLQQPVVKFKDQCSFKDWSTPDNSTTHGTSTANGSSAADEDIFGF